MADKEAAKTGRPTKYDPAHCETVLTLMKEGASICEVCLELDISRDTFYRWLKEHEVFSDTVKSGLWFSKGWWEKLGREGADGSKANINPTMWFMNMKNRFGQIDPSENIQWRDKQDHEHSGPDGGPMTVNVVRFSDDDNASE